jgi:hypothetical protein
MKTLSAYVTRNSNIPLCVSIREIEFEMGELETPSLKSVFELLKKNGFYYINDPVPLGDSYSNYNIDKIDLADFKLIPTEELKTLLSDKLREWAKHYNNAVEEADWFIGIIMGKLDPIVQKYNECYIFDLPATENNDKRHAHYTLYEFFVSVLFFQNRSNQNEIAYAEFFYE